MSLEKVTVGLVCHNEEDNIDLCLLEILSHQNLKYIHEVIVVDNSSTDRTPEKLRNWAHKCAKEIRVFESSENLIGKARQLIVDQCETEILLFTDADCMVPTDWIERHLENLKASEKIQGDIAGVCGPNRLPEFYDWQIAINYFLSTPLGHGFSPQALLPKEPRFVDHLPTTNSLFRISALRKTNGFRLDLMVGEDGEIGSQLQSLGFKMLMFPEPLVINHSARTLSEWVKRMFRFGGAQWVHSPFRSFVVATIIALLLPTLFWLTDFKFLIPVFGGGLGLMTFQMIHLKRVNLLSVIEALQVQIFGLITVTSYLLGFLLLGFKRPFSNIHSHLKTVPSNL